MICCEMMEDILNMDLGATFDMDAYMEDRRLAEDPGIAAGGGVVSTSLKLYLVQIFTIIGMCQIVNFVLKPTKQPRVIAEIIGGILLGPSFLGLIPGFNEKLFPADSINALKLTSMLGLMLFLFVVGLELDVSLLKHNWRKSFSISIGGQLFTKALSVPVSYLMYSSINNVEGVSFGEFIIFVGVSMSVTAFPVLSRILAEQKLLGTRVGLTTISAAAFDDVTAWSMLALVISLVNAGSPTDALWVFLIMVGFFVFMLAVVRVWLKSIFDVLNLQNSIVSHSVLSCIILMVIASAWFTQAIGVDAIFGAFIAGLCIPRDGAISTTLIHKIEDVVSVVLLPIYFAISGLKTDFSNLTTGKLWGTAFLVILASCTGKIIGCWFFARIAKMTQRESLCVGVLMNARGLVELIILNVGYDAKVIGQDVFTILVLMAVVTTFMATPLAAWIMPPKFHVDAREGLVTWAEGAENPEAMKPLIQSLARLAPFVAKSTDELRSKLMGEIRLLVCLPGTHIQLLTASMGAVKMLRNTGGEVHLARLMEDSNSLSADMLALNGPVTLNADPFTSSFQAFARRRGVKVVPHMIVSTPEAFSSDIVLLAQRAFTNTILVPYDPPTPHQNSAGAMVADIIRDASAAGASVAVALERGAFSQSPSTIVVPFTSLSHSECEALILALVMAGHNNMKIIALMVGVEGDSGPLDELAVNRKSNLSTKSPKPVPRFGEGTTTQTSIGNTSGLHATSVKGARGLLATFEDVEAGASLNTNPTHTSVFNKQTTSHSPDTSKHAHSSINTPILNDSQHKLTMAARLHQFVEKHGLISSVASYAARRRHDTQAQAHAARSILATAAMLFDVNIVKVSNVDLSSDAESRTNALIKELRDENGTCQYPLIVCGTDGPSDEGALISESEKLLGVTGATLSQAFPYMSILALHSPEGVSGDMGPIVTHHLSGGSNASSQ